MSTQTAIKLIDMVENPEEELTLIKAESVTEKTPPQNAN